ncbi:PREDICTED: uncharacterized protein LOC109192278 [Ipomoea nil]|uniref:uncharacterized protein LOC109192278 n=1 Tax=Ipomoea nil TaxID=35883 RepID=UPI00090177F0|nr:PREDICTED: uncharacterized protein LOC109192278 [Ipomoea nil]
MVGNYENIANVGFAKWLTLWKQKIPPKWKTLLWRVLSDILPTIQNLLIKRVEIDPVCAMCGVANEDIMHTLVSYSDGIAYAAAIIYHVWRARNGAVWDACLPRPRRVLAAAQAEITAWRQAHAPRRDPSPVMPSTVAQPTAHGTGTGTAQHAAPNHTPTQPPPSKCYVNAGYRHTDNTATVGVVILGPGGQFVSAYSAPLPHCFSPLMAEAYAFKEALSWLRERGEQNMELYTDCQVLQTYLMTPQLLTRSYVGYAIDGCRNHLSTFNYCYVNFLPRSQNILAHSLATTAFQYDTAMYWDTIPPDAISAYL